MEIIWKIISREGQGENTGKGAGNKNHNWEVQNRWGEVKNSMGNGEAKELICMTHDMGYISMASWYFILWVSTQ